MTKIVQFDLDHTLFCCFEMKYKCFLRDSRAAWSIIFGHTIYLVLLVEIAHLLWFLENRLSESTVIHRKRKALINCT